jgi:hypothetical protein
MNLYNGIGFKMCKRLRKYIIAMYEVFLKTTLAKSTTALYFYNRSW